MIRLLILGATGSIGSTCLKAFRNGLMPDVKIAGLTAATSPSLEKLASDFNSEFCYLNGNDTRRLSEFIDKTSPDIILNAIAGSSGLPATLTAISKGRDIALANKESVVMGGSFMLNEAKRNNVRIIPVDSEHSAIYHLLQGKKASRLIITASGGPFVDRKDTSNVTVKEALCHPTWKMGKKITVDSATLANKGLEVMEASLLFGFPPDKIDVTIHRQSIVHSMIETSEGAVYALLSPPDMTLPIVMAITGEGNSPKRLTADLPFSSAFNLSFEGWDRNHFPMLSLAYEALKLGGGYRIAYTSADECAVNAFLDGRISFNRIHEITTEVLSSSFTLSEPSSFEEILELDREARKKAEALC